MTTMPTSYLLEKTGTVEAARRWLLALESAGELLDTRDRNLDLLRDAAHAITIEIDQWRAEAETRLHTCPDCRGETVEDLTNDDTLTDHPDFTCTCDPWR